MKKELKSPAAVIVLVVATNATNSSDLQKFELSSYVVNRCHSRSKQKPVDTFITSCADHFLFHMPFCYRLN